MKEPALLPASSQPSPDDEVTALIFARGGVLYSGHISGAVRKWELPVAESSGDEEEEAVPAAVALEGGTQQQPAAQQQQAGQQQQGAGA